MVTGANLRHRAESFFIYSLYSLIVVAPIIDKSPRAKYGFKIFPASIEPSDAQF